MHRNCEPSFHNPTAVRIAISDLEPFLPGQPLGQGEESLEIRVATLERQVQALERQLQQRLSQEGASREQRSSPSRNRHSTTGPLPRHLVSVLIFAELHRIPEQKVHTHRHQSAPCHRGAWTDHDGQGVTLAFDAKGRQAFHHLYHELPLFVPCSRCPHMLPGHV